jgi:predicted dehydrogenase
MTTVGIIGAGDWGKNLIRNFHELPDCRLKICSDLDKKRLDYIKNTYRDVQVTTNPNDIINDKEIEAIIICSSAISHYSLAKASLSANKHIFIEKPMTLKSTEAEELVKLSSDKKLTLMVGHLLKYHPAVDKLKTMINSGEIGEVYYLYSQRVNLGKIRSDENALWSFAPHDISIILYLLGKEPINVTACGQAYLQKNIHDVVFVNMEFADKKMAHIHLSWLDPHKIRRLTVVGSKKMVVFDDMEPTDKIKIYDRGVDKNLNYETYAEYLTMRIGDMVIPTLKLTEPLKNECKHFLDCVKNKKKPLTDGMDGLRVVKVLESAQRSLEISSLNKSI